MLPVRSQASVCALGPRAALITLVLSTTETGSIGAVAAVRFRALDNVQTPAADRAQSLPDHSPLSKINATVTCTSQHFPCQSPTSLPRQSVTNLQHHRTVVYGAVSKVHVAG